jgi:glutathione S-transferase
MTPILYVGNKNYSSWSLRPWLALKWSGIPFEERVVALGGEGYGKGRIAEILAISPSGRVPALVLGDTTVWDSLAICEWAAEQAPVARLLPEDPLSRAVCRSLMSEMHSGFAAVRRDLPMNLRRRTQARDWAADTRADLARIEQVWTTTRARYGAGGSFLFGARTLADAFFAPVVTRLRTYGVRLSGVSATYSEAVLSDAAFREWDAAGAVEPWTMAATDAL